MVDSYDDVGLMLMTDSLSYVPTTKIEQLLNVAVENLMNDGLFLLFINDRSGYVLFDEFK